MVHDYVKTAFSRAEWQLRRDLEAARYKQRLSEIEAQKLDEVRALTEDTRKSPVRSGVYGLMAGGGFGALPGILLSSRRGAALGAGLGGAAGGYLGATIPARARRNLEDIQRGEHFSVFTGTPNTVGSNENFGVTDTALSQRQRLMLKKILASRANE